MQTTCSNATRIQAREQVDQPVLESAPPQVVDDMHDADRHGDQCPIAGACARSTGVSRCGACSPGSSAEYSRYRISSPFSQFREVRPTRAAFSAISCRMVAVGKHGEGLLDIRRLYIGEHDAATRLAHDVGDFAEVARDQRTAGGERLVQFVRRAESRVGIAGIESVINRVGRARVIRDLLAGDEPDERSADSPRPLA